MSVLVEILATVAVACVGGIDRPVLIAQPRVDVIMGVPFVSEWCVARGSGWDTNESDVTVQYSTAWGTDKMGPWIDGDTARRTVADGEFVRFVINHPPISRVRIRVHEKDTQGEENTSPPSVAFKVWPNMDWNGDSRVGGEDFGKLRREAPEWFEMFRRVLGVPIKNVDMQGEQRQIYLRRGHWGGE